MWSDQFNGWFPPTLVGLGLYLKDHLQTFELALYFPPTKQECGKKQSIAGRTIV